LALRGRYETKESDISESNQLPSFIYDILRKKFKKWHIAQQIRETEACCRNTSFSEVRKLGDILTPLTCLLEMYSKVINPTMRKRLDAVG
ncbi:hypothetical protein HHI36_010564, partial [Cryptolaemus montrouzieri]